MRDSVPLSSSAEPTGTDRCGLLTQGQLDVLRLVNRHLNSKEIAVRLGISPHTVDQRVRAAIKVLGVTRRSDAARLVDAFDRSAPTAPESGAPSPDPYQRLIHQVPDIDAESDAVQSDGAVGIQIRHADRTGGNGTHRLETEQRPVGSRSSLFPWSTSQQPTNRWSVGRRLAAVVGIAIAASFSVGMFLAGLESLARLVHL